MHDGSVLKRLLFDYIMVAAEITLSVAIIGSIFAGDEVITYHYFFIPFLMAAACMLPCLIIYLNEQLTIRQVLIQRVIQFVILEVVVLAFARWMIGDMLTLPLGIVITISLIIIDIGTYLLEWYFERAEATRLNEQLRKQWEQRNNK